MEIAEIAQHMPLHEENWHNQMQLNTIPVQLKSWVRKKIGGLVATNDYSKLRSPSRLGVSLREFELGDPLKSISFPHLVKQNAFKTRIDQADGRRTINIFLHSYEKMKFQSRHSKATKMQTALATATLINVIHTGLGHQVKGHILPESSLVEVLTKAQNLGQNSNHTYVISDFLSNEEHIHAEALDILHTCSGHFFKKTLFICIRDIIESTKDNPLRSDYKKLNSHLTEDTSVSASQGRFYSGEAYYDSLIDQLKNTRKELKSVHSDIIEIIEQDSIFSLIEDIELFIMR